MTVVVYALTYAHIHFHEPFALNTEGPDSKREACLNY